MTWRPKRKKPRSRLQDIRIMNELFPAADALAAEDGEHEAGAEYLLLAAFDLDDGSARRAFERAGADPDAFRDAVKAQHAEALRSVGIRPMDDDLLDHHIPPAGKQSGLHRGAPSGHELFRQVVKLVRSERSQLHGAYFVLVAAQTNHGTTARTLRHMNIDADELAAAARAEIDLVNSTSA
ncbi:MAG: Clp protease N-terminal domain-containing protein [Acidimicrobiales bacterium]